jgi:hypothetical protein
MAQRRKAAAVAVLGVTFGTLVCAPLAAAAATTSTTTSAPAGSKSPSSAATSLVKSAASAATKQKSVHFLAKSTESGRSVTISASSSATAGTQKVVLHANKSTGHVTGRLVDKIVYFKGDTFGLEEYLGMPATLAPKYTGKWIFFSPATKSYSSIANSFTLTAAIGQISMTGPYTKAKSTVGGMPATTIKGRNTATGKKGKAGSAVLSVSSTGTPLPIRFSAKATVSKKSVTDTVTYGRWGLKVSPVEPQGAIAASSITSSG